LPVFGSPGGHPNAPVLQHFQTQQLSRTENLTIQPIFVFTAGQDGSDSCPPLSHILKPSFFDDFILERCSQGFPVNRGHIPLTPFTTRIDSLTLMCAVTPAAWSLPLLARRCFVPENFPARLHVVAKNPSPQLSVPTVLRFWHYRPGGRILMLPLTNQRIYHCPRRRFYRPLPILTSSSSGTPRPPNYSSFRT